MGAPDDELFTFGFSQGGHAALVLQRALERRRVDVTATAVVGGVLDVERFFLSSIADASTATLPPTLRQLLRASCLREVRGNPDDPLRVRLRENAVDRWRLDAPIRVYHSLDDEEVFYGDMLVSVDRLRDRGADVTVRTLPGFDHVNGWVQAMPRAVRYFRSR